GHFNQSRHRITDKPEKIFERHSSRMCDLLCRSSPEGYQRPRSHCRCRADFSLTTACRTCNKSPGRNNLPYPCGCIHCLRDLSIRCCFSAVYRKEHCRKHTAGSGSRRCDNPVHTGIRLAHLQCLCNHFGHKIPAQRIAFFHITPHLTAHAPYKTAARFL